jgi:hypothetical protein
MELKFLRIWAQYQYSSGEYIGNYTVLWYGVIQIIEPQQEQPNPDPHPSTKFVKWLKTCQGMLGLLKSWMSLLARLWLAGLPIVSQTSCYFPCLSSMSWKPWEAGPAHPNAPNSEMITCLLALFLCLFSMPDKNQLIWSKTFHIAATPTSWLQQRQEGCNMQLSKKRRRAHDWRAHES